MALSLPPMMTTTWPVDSWLVDGADVILLVLFIDVAFGLRSITTDAAAFVGCRAISAIVLRQDIVLLLLLSLLLAFVQHLVPLEYWDCA